MLADLPRPVVFAHRGASGQAPENTMAAFELAAKQGSPAIELDVRLTRDNRVVVFHDATLQRTTNRSGRLAETNAVDLRSLNAGGRFSDQYQDARIPFLEEVFAHFGRRILINVQFALYARTPRRLVEEVCSLIRRHAVQRAVLLSSFHGSDLRRAKSLLEAVPAGLLAARGRLGAWARSFGFMLGDYDALHPHLADVTIQHVHRVHKLRRRIHVWTANDPADVARLAEWGVDGIFTDEPQAALRALGQTP